MTLGVALGNVVVPTLDEALGIGEVPAPTLVASPSGTASVSDPAVAGGDTRRTAAPSAGAATESAPPGTEPATGPPADDGTVPRQPGSPPNSPPVPDPSDPTTGPSSPVTDPRTDEPRSTASAGTQPPSAPSEAPPNSPGPGPAPQTPSPSPSPSPTDGSGLCVRLDLSPLELALCLLGSADASAAPFVPGASDGSLGVPDGTPGAP